jgi:tetratricopeptide (TPR) repeat protein
MRASLEPSKHAVSHDALTCHLGLLLLPVVSFSLFNWVFDHVIVMERDLPCCFFVFGGEFLGQFTDHPGGMLTWAGRFACQFSHYTWLGALAIAGCVSLFGLALHLVLAKRGGRSCLAGMFLPCMLLLVLHTLTVRVMMDALGLAAACAAMLGYLHLRGGTPRRLYAALLTPVMYVVLGAYVYMFALWVTALEWGENRPRSGLAFKVSYPLMAACMPLAAYLWVFPVSLRSAFAHDPVFVGDLPRGYGLIVAILYGYLLIMPFWPPLVRRARNLLPQRWRTADNGSAARVVTLSALALAATLLFRSFDNPASRELAGYVLLYQAEDWEGILSRVKEKPSDLLLVQFLVNRALCEKGRLLDDMFMYRQTWGSSGLVLQPSASESPPRSAEADIALAMYNSDLFFKMGHVNMAYRQAYDQISMIGPAYRSFRRMAECHMVNGRYEAARKYLTVLEKTVFHRGFARRYKAILADADASEAFFAAARARRPTVELHTITLAWTALLELVASGHKDRMAIEYLVAWRLLDKGSISIIAGNVRCFKEAGCSRLPRHVQEALFLQEVMTGHPVDMRGFSYDTNITGRFGELERVMSTLQGNPDAVSALRRQFGDTYLYFFITDRSPTCNDGIAYWSIGNELLSRGMTGNAILHYRVALQYKPDDAGIRGDLDKALAQEHTRGAQPEK